MKHLASVLVLSLTLVGSATIIAAQESKPVAPDNSAVNVRDRDQVRGVKLRAVHGERVHLA